MAPHIGWIGRNREIRVTRTRSGNGFRIRDRQKKHDAYAFPNSGGNVVVKFDRDQCVWHNPGPDWPTHRLPKHSLHRAVYYLIAIMWQAVAEDKRKELKRLRWEKNKAVCRSCHQVEPFEGYVDRRTGQCQCCDEFQITLAEDREHEEDMRQARAEMLAADADRTFYQFHKPMMDKIDADAERQMVIAESFEQLDSEPLNFGLDLD